MTTTDRFIYSEATIVLIFLPISKLEKVLLLACQVTYENYYLDEKNKNKNLVRSHNESMQAH